MLLLVVLLLWNGNEIAHATQGCGLVINNTLKSPGYTHPGYYPSNIYCNYTVSVPPNMTMKISFTGFYLEDDTACSYDYLKIVNDKGQMAGKYCGKRNGYTTLVNGDQVLITFFSDENVEEKGFLIHFTAVPYSTLPEPVAFYPLNKHYKLAEKDNRQPEGFPGDITTTNGPYNEPGGAYMFFGTLTSYIEFPNEGALDTRLSITLMCWVRPEGQEGTLFRYEKYDRGVLIAIVDGKFFIRIIRRDGFTQFDIATTEALQTGVWAHVAATYDFDTGNASLYNNGYLTNTQIVSAGLYISTNANKVRIGVIKGAIAEMKVYDVALDEAEIQASIRKVPPTIIFPDALLAIEGGILSCLARGTPPIYTTLKWNSTVLANTTNIPIIRLHEEGNYTCQAINQYGTVKGELRVSFTAFNPEILDFLTSEGYPVSYKRNFDNTSTYAIPQGRSMNIFFYDFDVEYTPYCNKDYLRITDGMGRTFGVYCGNKTGKNVLVTGDQVQIIFHSDNDIQRRGYLLILTLVREVFVGWSDGQSTIYIASGIAIVLFLVLCFILSFWCYRRCHPKTTKRSARSAREIIPLDKWELLPGQIEYGEELGRGAFGVVYQASLKRRAGIEIFDIEQIVKPEEPCQVVAVKVLQDDPGEQQKEEFLQEIEQMKLLGAHQNIVSLVGCCTLQEPKFLVIEYVPFGDLLHWLRRRRRRNNQNEATGDTEKRKCYEDKETFSVREEVRECDQVSTVAIEEEEDDHKVINQPLTEQTLQTIKSPPSRDNRDINLDIAMFSGNLAKLTSNDIRDQRNIGMLSVPSISHGNSNSSDISISTESVYDDNEDDAEETDSFNTQKLFSFAWQIAKGMNHLAEKDFIHRDLAARNILVGSDNRVKVADFGLMRQIYEDVYSAKNTKKLPVKWMAPESIFESTYTIKSDVWSFGILLWEMATMGSVPYPTLSNSELCRLLKTGYRMERPDMCCDEVYELMSDCWNEDPSSRPSFSDVINRLEPISVQLFQNVGNTMETSFG